MNRESWEPETTAEVEGVERHGESLLQPDDLAKAELHATLPQFSYHVAMPEPSSHLFEVTLQVRGWESPNPGWVDLKMPVWTPGSYLVREYARHLQDFAATTEDGAPLPWRKVAKNHWRIDVQGHHDFQMHYRIYANELSVRTNHLDITHGYFNGAALFCYVPGWEQVPLQVEIALPRADWHVTTPLAPLGDRANTFIAANFDELVDSPFEIGKHRVYDFDVAGKPHQLAVWGDGNLEPDPLLADMQRVIEVEADLFGGLPYDRYLFLLHLSSQGFGGLEHRNCCSLIYQRFGFRNRDKYDRFIQLVAHEFFHLWNVKRIRPKALETFDYDQENYTPSLWFSEGTTSYYDLVIPYRAGVYDVRTYFNSLNKEITRFLTTPGRQVQPLAESSYDAWIKLYRQDANSPNSQMSYYLKGEMVSLLLDLLIRERHNNTRSLDDVMRQMWGQFGQPEIGFTPQDLEQTIAAIAGTDLTEFFQRCLQTTDDLPFDNYLEPFGLRLVADGDNSLPYLGLTLKSENGREVIKFVERHSPAQRVGMDAGDELLAINGIRVTADQLNDRLRDFQPGHLIQVAFFHQEELRLTMLTLEDPRPTRYQIGVCDRPSRRQEQKFQGWLGVPLSSLQ